MNNSQADSLDPRALVTMVIVSIMEFEIFTFSKITVAAAKQDAWLAIIVGAFCGTGLIYLLMKLAARFPGKGYFEYLKIVWGKPLGNLFSMLYLLYFIYFLVLLFYEVSLVNKLLFLPKTPKIISLAIFALSIIWLNTYGIAAIVRFFQLMLPFLLLPLLLLEFLLIRTVNFHNFLPLLGGGILPVLKGAFCFLGANQGAEVLLFLAPFLTRIDQGTKPAMLGFVILSINGWINAVTALGILGVAGMKESVLPGVDTVTLIELPGFPVERFGLLLTMPWLIAIYTTMAIFLYMLDSGFGQLFNIRPRKIIISVLAAVPLLLGCFVPDISWHETLRKYLTLVTPFLVYALPVITLALALIRKKGNNEA
jgi:spore germination protein (amino acid permease)